MTRKMDKLMHIRAKKLDLPHYRRLRFDYVEKEVADAFKMSRNAIHCPSKANRYARPRQAMYYFAYRYTNFSMPSIGERMDKDHTSVMYGMRRWMKLIDQSDELMAIHQKIERALARKSGDRAPPPIPPTPEQMMNFSDDNLIERKRA